MNIMVYRGGVPLAFPTSTQCIAMVDKQHLGQGAFRYMQPVSLFRA